MSGRWEVNAYCGGDRGCGWEGPVRLVTNEARRDFNNHLLDVHGIEFGTMGTTAPVDDNPKENNRG